jgi:hypothetical protein
MGLSDTRSVVSNFDFNESCIEDSAGDADLWCAAGIFCCFDCVRHQVDKDLLNLYPVGGYVRKIVG